MNLDQIATKCFILALFIRDDGQRLLLGDGYYDFNQKLQHFQGNTIANDVVEIQGDSGQLLAGQVMRSGTQKFEGYIGDATTSRQIIEQKRSDFMAFFRIKHFYKVIYIFPDGTAIQRQRGYLTDAPTIPEIFQKFPEYSVALNFEDANYYEYAEDEHGDEIYAHIAELALAGGATGGLIWGAIGAVTSGISWSGIQTAQGEYISITNELSLEAPLASVEMLGKATQDGTPTPDSPMPISVVTGENVVKVVGKNLFDLEKLTATDITISDGTATGTSGSFNTAFGSNGIALSAQAGQYTLGITAYTDGNQSTDGIGLYFRIRYTDGTYSPMVYWQNADTTAVRKTYTTELGKTPSQLQLSFSSKGSNVWHVSDIQLEKGSATAYEPYQGQEYKLNLGKNLLDIDNIAVTNAYISNTGVETSSQANLLTDYITAYPSTAYTLSTNTMMYNLAFSEFDENKTFISRTSISATKTDTITTNASTRYVRVSFNRNNITAITRDYVKSVEPQLELGSQASSYAPYFTPIELAKIGNYQDRIYKEDSKWYVEKQVGKVVLDGSETWEGLEVLTNTTGAFTKYDGILQDTRCLSNYFVERQDYADDVVGIVCRPYTTSLISLRFSPSTLSAQTIAGIKTWLSTHPTTVYYALATPTTTEITNEALIAQLEALGAASLYVGANNIGTETQNAVPTLKIEYYTEVDLDGAGYEWEPGGNTAKTIVTVAGVDSAWPIWTVQGGAQNPTLTNITTGQTITWQGFVPAGQTLTINMAEMTADLAGANVFEFITGEWIRLAPGNNTLVYNAGNADKPSTLSWNGVLA